MRCTSTSEQSSIADLSEMQLRADHVFLKNPANRVLLVFSRHISNLSVPPHSWWAHFFA
jgi:hypothetical protein